MPKHSSENIPMLRRRGRPRHFASPKRLELSVRRYFALVDRRQAAGLSRGHATVHGMCEVLRISRSTLAAYERRDGFADVIVMAKAVIAAQWEERAYEAEFVKSAAFAIARLDSGATRKRGEP